MIHTIGRDIRKSLGIQFFAEESQQNTDPQPNSQGTPPEGQQQGQQQDPPNPQQNHGEKMFTQSEVNALATNEKRQGRAAALRELGINPEDKAAIERYKQLIKSNQTESERLQNELKTANTDKQSAEARAEAAELKLTAIQKGVNPKYVDDIAILVKARITDGKSAEAILDEMKTSHPAFFDVDGGQSSAGTGTQANPPRRRNKTESIAERLSKNGSNKPKSSFFKDT